ncbi:MAG: hypothetical protein L7S56_06500 [Candidatus Poseidonia sp.]|nr:hypothetical protein [Poseidonia sp.]
MGGQRFGRWSSKGALLAALMLCSLFPTVSAAGGGAVIDVSSFSLENFETIESADYTLEFNLTEVDNSEADIDVMVTLSSLDGTVFDTLYQNLTIGPLNNQSMSFNLSALPFGYTVVNATLSGDTGLASAGQSTTIERTIQRLRPLAIALGSQSSLLLQGINQAGETTGNTTLHDGDRLELQIPVINDGDINWTGNVHFSVENGVSQSLIELENVSVPAMSSTQVFFEDSSLILEEGVLNWSVSLSGILNNDSFNQTRQGQESVLPPPLPVMMGILTSNAEFIRSGEILNISLMINNTGLIDFDGAFECTLDGDLIATQEVLINASSSKTLNFSTTAKPAILICDSRNVRVDSSSNFPLQALIEMDSAMFESAGSSSPTLLGGPWHKGDEIHATMLIRNTGDLSGRTRLVLEQGAFFSSGEWVTLEAGQAGEVTSSLAMFDEGALDLNWTLESDDGVVQVPSSGQVSIPVQQQQSIEIELDEMIWTSHEGVSFTMRLSLDEGKSRPVFLQLGYETSDTTFYLQEYEILLEEGQREQHISFGQISAEKVVLKVTPVGWSAGPGALSTSLSIPDERTLYWVTFNPVTSPIRPIVGDSAAVTLIMHQSGPVSQSIGELQLTDEQGVILGQTETESWTLDGDETITLNVVWPEGTNVILRAVWAIDGQVITEQSSFVSGEPLEQTSANIPYAAMMWGGLLGGVLVLVLRLREQRKVGGGASIPTKKETVKPSSTTTQKSSLSSEKKEVQCPECERLLRVPINYSGTVGCPDCTTKFDVQIESVEQMPVQKIDDPADEVEVVPPKPSSREARGGKIEIHCPDCAQSLRIPASYEGSVRCPACTTVFKADEGVS